MILLETKASGALTAPGPSEPSTGDSSEEAYLAQGREWSGGTVGPPRPRSGASHPHARALVHGLARWPRSLWPAEGTALEWGASASSPSSAISIPILRLLNSELSSSPAEPRRQELLAVTDAFHVLDLLRKRPPLELVAWGQRVPLTGVMWGLEGACASPPRLVRTRLCPCQPWSTDARSPPTRAAGSSGGSGGGRI